MIPLLFLPQPLPSFFAMISCIDIVEGMEFLRHHRKSLLRFRNRAISAHISVETVTPAGPMVIRECLIMRTVCQLSVVGE